MGRSLSVNKKIAIQWLAVNLLWILTYGAESAEQTTDFNRDVRPILSRHCFQCHGQDESHRQAELRLDQRASAVAPAESGLPAIVPGDPDKSELIVRITASDPGIRMPPEGEGALLSDEQTATLRRWIEQQAPYARHWSFVAPRRHGLPRVRQASWPAGPIDYFIARELERHSLQPSPPADRFTLIRRVSFDLRGIPPSPDEVEAFVQDSAPHAYERLVDRFLQDPAYGERWARLWLDLARYADSRGYGSDPLRPNIWRYRDWVIDALNENLPFDQFTVEQLAGDLLPDATLSQLIATAFHRNTMTNTEGGTDDEEFRVAAVRDRVDTTMQVWMGLTVGCAKCHNHKYDPVTQREYYELLDFFNQTADTDRTDEAPTIEAITDRQKRQKQRIEQQISKRQQQLKSLQKALAQEQSSEESSSRIAGQIVRIEIPGEEKILSLAEVQVLSESRNLAPAGQARQSSTAYDAPAELANDGNTDGHFYDSRSTTHTATEKSPWWEVDLGGRQTIDEIHVFNRTDGQVGRRLVRFRVSILDANRRTVWQRLVVEAPNPSTKLPVRKQSPLVPEIAAIERQIAQLEETKPKAPLVAIMRDLPADKRRETRIMERGNFLSPGEQVEAAVPGAFAKLPPDAPLNRLGVARWLVDPQNPLTARVTANRLWSQLFGVGLVETEEDFGTQGELPSHPELLDWLAISLMDGNWDVKRFLKTIVTSATYQQSSRATRVLLEQDPRNRLLARGPRFRLEAEMVRDQALRLGGLLSRKMYGPSVYPPQPPGLWRAAFNGRDRSWETPEDEDRWRRGLYTFWRRTVPYPSMATFDAPSREICTVRRIRTTTPLQALVTLNDPVYVEAAQALARRILGSEAETPADKCRMALRLCLVRQPTNEQVVQLNELYHSQLQYYREHPEEARQVVGQLPGYPPLDSQVAECAAWTMVASVLLNLDAVVTKG